MCGEEQNQGLWPSCVHFTQHHFLGIGHVRGLIVGPGDAETVFALNRLDPVGMTVKAGT